MQNGCPRHHGVPDLSCGGGVQEGVRAERGQLRKKTTKKTLYEKQKKDNYNSHSARSSRSRPPGPDPAAADQRVSEPGAVDLGPSA